MTLFIVSPVSLFAQTDSIPDALTSRLFAAPTARSLPEDNGLIGFSEIVVPNFAYGVSEEFMIRGGFTPFTVAGKILYFGLASLQVAHYGDLEISGGIVLTDMTGDSRKWESALYGFGIMSYGNDAAAIHAGFGGGYSGTRESNSAVFMIGGEVKLARTAKIISENWIISETGSYAYSLGVRIFGRSLSGELGGAIVTENNKTVTAIVPWVGITFIL